MLTRTFCSTCVFVYCGALVILLLLLNESIEGGLLSEHVSLVAFGIFGCVPGPIMNLVVFFGAAVFGRPMAVIAVFDINPADFLLTMRAGSMALIL